MKKTILFLLIGILLVNGCVRCEYPDCYCSCPSLNCPLIEKEEIYTYFNCSNNMILFNDKFETIKNGIIIPPDNQINFFIYIENLANHSIQRDLCIEHNFLNIDVKNYDKIDLNKVPPKDYFIFRKGYSTDCYELPLIEKFENYYYLLITYQRVENKGQTVRIWLE